MGRHGGGAAPRDGRLGERGGVGQPGRHSSISRRAFLGAALALGAAGLAGGRWPTTAAARERIAPRAVLGARVVHRWPDDFGPGEAQAVRLLQRTEGGGLHAVAPDARYQSAVLPLPFLVTHVGLRWAGADGSPGALELAVRTSANGRDWSPWLACPAGCAAPAGDGYCTPLVRVPAGAFVQYRLRFPAAPSPLLRWVSLHALNPFDGPEREPTSAAVPWPRLPFPFRSREEWGCDEALRFDTRGAESWPRVYVPVKKLVVHHTATTNDYDDAAAEVRAIYAYHARELDWGDIGYHALIGRDGVVYEGRRGRGPTLGVPREALSPGVVGGHAFFHNFGTDGYALIGTFTETPLPAAMRERLVDLLVYKARWWGLDPLAGSDFLRSDAIWHRDVANVSGHRDLVATECPGDQVYRLLPELRATAAERLGGRAAQEAGRTVFLMAPPPADTTARAAALHWGGLGLLAPGWQFSYYLERWRREGDSGAAPADTAQPAWSAYSPQAAVVLTDLPDGHYTLHVRARDPLAREAVYEAQVTFRVSDELLADNEDSGQTVRRGAWERRFDGTGKLGESWEVAPPGRGERVFEWCPLVAEAGEYEVWVRWPRVDDLARNAPFAVLHAAGIYHERCDQQAAGGAWVRLGGARRFRLLPGRRAVVRLDNDADGPVAADAIKLVLRRRLGGG